jgi:Ca-activated chloride channel family protein
MRLAEPFWLILLVVVPLPWLFDRSRPRISWPTLEGFGPRGRRVAALRAAIPGVLRGLALACLVVALARPQTVAGRTRIAGQGVAIVVALDHSPSMTTPDFRSEADHATITRLEAAKRTLARFVAGRPDDLIGLVVFAKYADLPSAPTLEQEFLLGTIRSVRPAHAGDYGTNLGDAIVRSLGALKGATPAKKVLVLLTDGRNNPARTQPSPIDPEQAAELARELGVTVHTIAVGRAGTVVRAVEPVTKLEVSAEAEGPDLEGLERLAKAGGGKAFVAADADALDRVFAAIDTLEKSPVRGEVRTRYREEYAPWTVAALLLVALDRWLADGRLRRLP